MRIDGEKGPVAPPEAGGSGPPGREGRIGLFAKHWTPGKAKTRLAAKIGKPAASKAARCFIEATLARLGSVEGEHVLAYSPAGERASV